MLDGGLTVEDHQGLSCQGDQESGHDQRLSQSTHITDTLQEPRAGSVPE
jgi:hypothetical protein